MPTAMEKHAHSPEVVTSLPLSSTGRCLARSSEVGSQIVMQGTATRRIAVSLIAYITPCAAACLGRYTLLADEENLRLAMFERRLPFFGCGIGWCCFLLGFLCPLIWYIAALLYYCKYYNRDPRERPGLAASAFLAVIFTAATIVTLSVLLIMCTQKRLNSCACPS